MNTLQNEVLLLIPNLGLGGAQRVFHDHSSELAKYYNVTEVVFNLENKNVYDSQNKIKSLEVEGGGSIIKKFENFWKRVIRLKKIKEELNITFSISHLEGADYINILSKGSDKVILCIHGSKLHDRNITGSIGWIRRRLLIPLLYRQATAVVAVSRGIQRELVEELGLPASKVQVINNFFDLNAISQQRTIEPPAPYTEILAKYPVIVTACRFAPEKNLFALLEVFAQLRQRLPQSKLLLIGKGEQYQGLLDRCRALSLPIYQPGQSSLQAHAAAVLFTGFQSNPHMFVARATLFVLPSLNEGFPMALGEAMACGIPVAASDCPTGPREILAPGTDNCSVLRGAEMAAYGVLLPIMSDSTTYSMDVSIWTNSLIQLLENPIERKLLGRKALERMEDFSRQRIAAKWVQLLKELR